MISIEKTHDNNNHERARFTLCFSRNITKTLITAMGITLVNEKSERGCSTKITCLTEGLS